MTSFPPVTPNRQYWGTFYYPWYAGSAPKGHWDELGHHPPATWASMYKPDLGLYSSNDANITKTHLNWMDHARFDFAIVSWWGKSSFPDQTFALMLNEAVQHKIKLAIYHEQSGYNPNLSVDQVVSDLKYIYDNYASSPAFFRVGSNPAIFVYGSNATIWSQARKQMYQLSKPVFVSLKIFPHYTDYTGMIDSWHQYAPAVDYATVPGFSAWVSPGYVEYPEVAVSRDRTTIPYEPLPRNAAGFATNLKKMQNLSVSQAQFLLIETFNEWHEGTQIEPGYRVDHNDAAEVFSQVERSYGTTYLDMIASRP